MLLKLVIYTISYIRSLVACQSYRNLGLCWSVSNQRFLALPERGYVHQSTVPKDCNKCRWFYPHRWDKFYWNGNNDSKPFSPFSKSRKHYRTPKCISPQVSTWLIVDCLLILRCFVYESFRHAPSPKRCFDHQGIALYPDSTRHSAEHRRGTVIPDFYQDFFAYGEVRVNQEYLK